MLKTLAAFLIVFISVNLLCPRFEPPVKRGPNTTLTAFRDKITTSGAQTFIIGSSRYIKEIDLKHLNNIPSGAIMKIETAKAGTAWMYAITKNVVPNNSTVIITYAGWQLTFPELFAESSEKEINFFAHENEPDIDRLAYMHRMPHSEYWLRRFLPLYASRNKIIQAIGDLFNFNPSKLQLLGNELAAAKIDSKAQKKHEQRMWDFTAEINRSLLPLIIKISTDNNLKLYFIPQNDPFYTLPDNPTIEKNYHKHLKDYIKAHTPQTQPTIH